MHRLFPISVAPSPPVVIPPKNAVGSIRMTDFPNREAETAAAIPPLVPP